MARIFTLDWHNESHKRVLMGMAILAVLAIMLAFQVLTPFVFDAFVIVLVWIATYEVYRVKKLSDKGVRDYFLYPFISVAYLIFLMGILMSFALWLHIMFQVIWIAVLCLYVLLMSYTDRKIQKQAALEKTTPGKLSGRIVKEYILLILYPAMMMFALLPINHLDRWVSMTVEGATDYISTSTLGLFVLLLVFVTSMFSDTFAYCVGRLLKGKLLVPRLSPKKTINGAVGGLFGGMTGALVVLLIMSTSTTLQEWLTQTIGNATAVMVFTIVLGLFASIVTQGGDLFASWIKRRHDVKDFGRIIPGHGGLMDRMDGIVFNAVFMMLVFLPMVLWF